jgi:hypothetical protein
MRRTIFSISFIFLSLFICFFYFSFSTIITFLITRLIILFESLFGNKYCFILLQQIQGNLKTKNFVIKQVHWTTPRIALLKYPLVFNQKHNKKKTIKSSKITHHHCISTMTNHVIFENGIHHHNVEKI